MPSPDSGIQFPLFPFIYVRIEKIFIMSKSKMLHNFHLRKQYRKRLITQIETKPRQTLMSIITF